MRFPLDIPIILSNVKIIGPSGSVNLDMLLDTGAAFTSVSWTDLKIIGYDPAGIQERQDLVTANGVIEVPKLTV